MFQKHGDIINNIRILYIEEDGRLDFDARTIVENEIEGQEFTNLSEVKNVCNSFGLNLVRYETISEFMHTLNGENYPTTCWVSYVYINYLKRK